MAARASRRSDAGPAETSREGSPPARPQLAHHNAVHVIGRVAAEPEPRTLPSGDQIVVWRLVVERDGPPVPGRPHLDTLECTAWTAKLRRTVLAWQPGDIAEVRGSLRRRFWRAGPALNSRYEVEAREVRRLAKSAPRPA